MTTSLKPLTRAVNVRFHACDVYCGRAGLYPSIGQDAGEGYLGNPYRPAFGKKDDPRERVRVVRLFLGYFRHRMGLVWNERCAKEGVKSSDEEFIDVVTSLRGKALGCWCVPALCHVDVYVAWHNEGPRGLAALEERMRKLEEAS